MCGLIFHKDPSIGVHTLMPFVSLLKITRKYHMPTEVNVPICIVDLICIIRNACHVLELQDMTKALRYQLMDKK